MFVGGKIRETHNGLLEIKTVKLTGDPNIIKSSLPPQHNTKEITRGEHR